MAAIAYNGDLSTEILLRLPVKSVLNLKTVSKQWHSIISDPRYRQTHASRQYRVNATGLSFGQITNQYDVLHFLSRISQTKSKFPCHDISGVDPRSTFNLTCMSSCNGLLLLKSESWLPGRDQKYFVYNPTTKEYKDLAHCYKVVILYRRYENSRNFYIEVYSYSRNFYIEVYSSKEDTLKPPVIMKTDSLHGYSTYDIYGYNRGIFCNGSIHWLSYRATSMVCFDLHSECIKEIPTPTPKLCGPEVYYFGESRGHLHFVTEDRAGVLDVHELRRDHSEWFLKYQVHLDSVFNLPKYIYPRCFGLSIFEDYGEEEEEEESTTMVILVSDEWVEYNFKKKNTKKLCRNMMEMPYHVDVHPWRGWLSSHQVIPTLACV